MKKKTSLALRALRAYVFVWFAFYCKIMRENAPEKSCSNYELGNYDVLLYKLLFTGLRKLFLKVRKTDNVDLNLLIRNCKNTFHCVQMLLPIEQDSLRLVSTSIYLLRLTLKNGVFSHIFLSCILLNSMNRTNND